MNKIKTSILLFLIFIPFFAFAQEIQYPSVPGAPTPTAKTTFPEYVKYLFNLSITVAGVIALGVLIWAGISWLTSAGNPTAIAEAKEKIVGAFIGLIILLSSYLILTTINPQLTILKVEKFEPKTGVYLINSSGKKIHVASDTRNLFTLTDATQIEFISSSTELFSVFVYKDEDFKGDKQEIRNTSGPISLPFYPRSIYFLWRKPGFYLYDEPGFELSSTFPYPFYLSSNTSNLGEWSKKTDSIRIIDSSKEIRRGAILFSGNYEEKCAIVLNSNDCDTITGISDLSASSSSNCPNYLNPMGLKKDELNSLLVFTVDTTKQYSGEVIFYDQINCTGNSLTITPTDGELKLDSFSNYSHPEGGTWERRVLSFRIKGSYNVVLMTSPTYTQCQATWESDETGCVPSIKSSAVYNPADPNKRPEKFIIIPSSE